jgi:hypothetical protein
VPTIETRELRLSLKPGLRTARESLVKGEAEHGGPAPDTWTTKLPPGGGIFYTALIKASAADPLHTYIYTHIYYYYY